MHCFEEAVKARGTGSRQAIQNVLRIEDEVDDLEEELAQQTYRTFVRGALYSVKRCCVLRYSF